MNLFERAFLMLLATVICTVYRLYFYIRKLANKTHDHQKCVKEVEINKPYRTYRYDEREAVPVNFKREKITAPEDIALFDSYEFINPSHAYDEYYSPVRCYRTHPVTKEMKFNNPEWLIDRERNVFLTGLGGGALEIPKFFALVWNNNIIVFALNYEQKKDETGQYTVTLTILRIFAPKGFVGADNEIIELIKEALTVKYFGPRACTLDLEFTYKPQYILEGDDYKNQNVLFRL